MNRFHRYLGERFVASVVTLFGVGLSLTDPVPERLVMHAELLGQAPDDGLRVRLAVQAYSALT